MALAKKRKPCYSCYMTTARSGFTLVEVLLVIAILSTLFGLSVVSYRNFQAGQAVVQAAETLRTNLRFAQSQALAGVKDCPRGGILRGWEIVPSSNRYDLYILCYDPDPAPPDNSDATLYRSIQLPQRVMMNVSPASLGHILFQPVNRDVLFSSNQSPPVPLSDIEVILTVTNGSRSASVVVRRSGDIF